MFFNRKKPLTLLSLKNTVPEVSASGPALRKESPPPPVRVKPNPSPVPQAVAPVSDAEENVKDYDTEIIRVLDALQQLLHSEIRNVEPRIADNREKGFEGILLPKTRGAAAGRGNK